MKIPCARCGGPTRHRVRHLNPDGRVHDCTQALGACGVEVTDPPRRGNRPARTFLWKSATLSEGILTSESYPDAWHAGGKPPDSPFPSAALAHQMFADRIAREVAPGKPEERIQSPEPNA